MKRFINPDIDTINAIYRIAKQTHMLVIERISRDFRFREIDKVQQWVGTPDGDQIIYLLSKKELTHFTFQYEVILNAA